MVLAHVLLVLAAGVQAGPSPSAEAVLPTLQLRAKAPIVADPKTACTVLLSGSGETPLAGLVRIRGGVSRGAPKKSYSVTLDAPVSWLGMAASRHWILNAAFIDRSLMRHKLSYDLFRSLSTADAKRYAVESRFVEVVLNDRYDGVYLLMQRIDHSLLGLKPFEPDATAHACIYKAVDHAANFTQPGRQGYEQQEPDEAVKAYWGPLEEFNRFVSGAPDPEFHDPRAGIAARLDVANAIDFHLLVLLTSNLDGITKNFILARDVPKAGAPPPRFFFVPWDYDATFGRNWDATPVDATAWLSNRLFDRLLGDAGFRKAWAARWRRLREREFSLETLHRRIDENERTLGAAAGRNAARWQADAGAYPDRLSLPEDLAQMKKWIAARLAWLDAEIRRRGG